MIISHNDFPSAEEPWQAHLTHCADLTVKLPDGDARMFEFLAQMEAASDPDEFMLREPVVVDGMLVTLFLPGPLAMAFLAELREAVAAQGVAA